MAVGDAVNDILINLAVMTNFQPAAGVEVVIFYINAGGIVFIYDGVGVMQILAGGATLSAKMFITNGDYLRFTGSGAEDYYYTGIQTQ